MKVLVISQTVFSKTSNMGKTLTSYFTGFQPNELAQLYFHSEKPTNPEICQDYYRFSDVDALKSIFSSKRTGTKIEASDVRDCDESARIDTGISRNAYKVGSRHKAWILLLRDIIWGLSKWNNTQLLQWVDDVKPDVIFFASGDGAFSYRIAKWLKERLNVPMVMVCVDDYYINNRNKSEFLGRFRQKLFLKSVKKTVADVDGIFTICDTMNEAYTKLFRNKCFTLHTSAEFKELKLKSDAAQVSYIGNVGYNRYRQLIDLGKAISTIPFESTPHCIDVYSGSINEEYITPLKNGAGIVFHGSVSASDVPKIMENSVAVIHTETFEEETQDLVRFSVSTKIAESLMYGPCLIAYGPEGIASIDYLKENGAAYVITRPEDLKSSLEEILSNAELRQQIVKRARALAKRNHSADVNPKKVRQWLQDAIDAGPIENRVSAEKED
ncbi:glycosyltransferase family protein [Pygmaiobacter massiliensis]|uniref:glycosyltransferase family protein n=1 Tax=Pygmaiobacter massiliensis TaxID=1917873 RepID=UPI000C7BD2DA|nr:glycosyltransferase [Pygmaiobacter massiliensis]